MDGVGGVVRFDSLANTRGSIERVFNTERSVSRATGVSTGCGGAAGTVEDAGAVGIGGMLRCTSVDIGGNDSSAGLVRRRFIGGSCCGVVMLRRFRFFDATDKRY